MQWLRRADSKAFARHQSRDRTWTWAEPSLLARFLNAKSQVLRGLKTSVNYRIDPSTKKPKTGNDLEAAKRYYQTMMTMWVKCNRDGASAWSTEPENKTTLRLPKSVDSAVSWSRDVRLGKDQITASFRNPSGKGSSFNGDTRYLSAVTRMSCPTDGSLRGAIWLIAPTSKKVTGSKLLSSYLRAKSKNIEQAASSTRQRAATQQAELRATRAQAQTSAARAAELKASTDTVRASLQQTTAELDLKREQAAQGAPVDDAALAALEADVTDLTVDLNEMNDEWVYAQEEADMAEDAYMFQEDLFAETGTPEELLQPDAPPIEDVAPLDTDAIDPWAEEMPPAEEIAEEEALVAEEEKPSFLNQYKWHLAAGGAVVAIGAWFYFTKYKPAQEAAATAALKENFDDDEDLF